MFQIPGWNADQTGIRDGSTTSDVQEPQLVCVPWKRCPVKCNSWGLRRWTTPPSPGNPVTRPDPWWAWPPTGSSCWWGAELAVLEIRPEAVRCWCKPYLAWLSEYWTCPEQVNLDKKPAKPRKFLKRCTTDLLSWKTYSQSSDDLLDARRAIVSQV